MADDITKKTTVEDHKILKKILLQLEGGREVRKNLSELGKLFKDLEDIRVGSKTFKDFQDIIEDVEKDVKTLKKSLDKELNTSLKDLLKTSEKLDKALAMGDITNILRLSDELHNIQGKVENINKELENYNDTIEKGTQKVSELKDEHKEVLETIDDEVNKLISLKERQDELNQYTDSYLEVHDKISDKHQKNLELNKKEIKDAEEKIKQANERKQNIEEEIKKQNELIDNAKEYTDEFKRTNHIAKETKNILGDVLEKNKEGVKYVLDLANKGILNAVLQQDEAIKRFKDQIQPVKTLLQSSLYNDDLNYLLSMNIDTSVLKRTEEDLKRIGNIDISSDEGKQEFKTQMAGLGVYVNDSDISKVKSQILSITDDESSRKIMYDLGIISSSDIDKTGPIAMLMDIEKMEEDLENNRKNAQKELYDYQTQLELQLNEFKEKQQLEYEEKAKQGHTDLTEFSIQQEKEVAKYRDQLDKEYVNKQMQVNSNLQKENKKILKQKKQLIKPVDLYTSGAEKFEAGSSFESDLIDVFGNIKSVFRYGISDLGALTERLGQNLVNMNVSLDQTKGDTGLSKLVKPFSKEIGALGVRLTGLTKGLAGLAGPIGLLGMVFGTAWKMFTFAEGKLVEINRSFLDDGGITNLGIDMINTADAAGKLTGTLDTVVQKAHEVATARIPYTEHIKALNVIQESGMVLADLELKYGNYTNATSQAIAMSKISGQSIETLGRLMGNMMDQMKSGPTDIKKGFVDMNRAMTEGKINSNLFYGAIQSMIPSLGAYGTTISEVSHLMKTLRQNTLGSQESVVGLTKTIAGLSESISVEDYAGLIGVGEQFGSKEIIQQGLLKAVDKYQVDIEATEESIKKLKQEFESASVDRKEKIVEELRGLTGKKSALEARKHRAETSAKSTDLMTLAAGASQHNLEAGDFMKLIASNLKGRGIDVDKYVKTGDATQFMLIQDALKNLNMDKEQTQIFTDLLTQANLKSKDFGIIADEFSKSQKEPKKLPEDKDFLNLGGDVMAKTQTLTEQIGNLIKRMDSLLNYLKYASYGLGALGTIGLATKLPGMIAGAQTAVTGLAGAGLATKAGALLTGGGKAITATAGKTAGLLTATAGKAGGLLAGGKALLGTSIGAAGLGTTLGLGALAGTAGYGLGTLIERSNFLGISKGTEKLFTKGMGFFYGTGKAEEEEKLMRQKLEDLKKKKQEEQIITDKAEEPIKLQEKIMDDHINSINKEVVPDLTQEQIMKNQLEELKDIKEILKVKNDYLDTASSLLKSDLKVKDIYLETSKVKVPKVKKYTYNEEMTQEIERKPGFYSYKASKTPSGSETTNITNHYYLENDARAIQQVIKQMEFDRRQSEIKGTTGGRPWYKFW